MQFARNVFGGQENARPEYDNIASAVFTTPQIGTCGLTEDEAVEQHGDVLVFTSTFRQAGSVTERFMGADNAS